MQPCYKCTLVVKIACNTKTCGSLPALEILLIVQIHSMVIFLVFYLKPFNIFYLFLSLHFRNKLCASRLGFRNPFADRLKRTAAGSVHCSPRLPSECWSQRCVGPGGRRQHRLHGRGSERTSTRLGTLGAGCCRRPLQPVPNRELFSLTLCDSTLGAVRSSCLAHRYRRIKMYFFFLIVRLGNCFGGV